MTLHAWLAAGDTLVVDVREPREYEREHIAGALLMPLSRLAPHSLPSDKRIVLCCAMGCRSKTAARRLGLPGLAHLEGGMDAWLAAGLPFASVRVPQPMLSPFGAPAQLA